MIVQSPDAPNMDLITKIVPSSLYKQRPRVVWQDAVQKEITGLNTDMISYLSYQLEEFRIEEPVIEEITIQRFSNCVNKSIRAGLIL